MTKRILVVDDDPGVVEMETEILRMSGFEVDVATRGDEALEKLSLAAYNAVLVDINMPGMDGYELTERLRRLPLHRETPVVIVTGSGKPDALHRGLDVGAVVFLRKPFRAEALRAVVGSVVT